MDEGKKYEVRQWLIKSQRDLGAVLVLLESEPVYLDIAAYHCQQSAEKAIKGYLTHQDIVFQKTHDLSRLLALCALQDSRFGQWRALAAMLTPYATEFRYPGDVLEPSRAEVEHAFEMTKDFLNFVLRVLPDEIGL